MKTLFFLLLSFCASAQVATNTWSVVNLNDNLRLQFNGNPVKQKAVVTSFTIYNTKEFQLEVQVQSYESVAGAYGNYIPTTIAADGVLTQAQKDALLLTYGDKYVRYSTAGHWTDVSGNIVAAGTAGAITELAYWQQFKLNQVAGTGTLTTQGAMDEIYLIVTALINKLNSNKNW